MELSLASSTVSSFLDSAILSLSTDESYPAADSESMPTTPTHYVDVDYRNDVGDSTSSVVILSPDAAQSPCSSNASESDPSCVILYNTESDTCNGSYAEWPSSPLIEPTPLLCSTPISEPREPPTKKKKVLCSSSLSSLDMLSSSCCEKRCVAHFTLAEIENAKERFSSRNQKEKNQFLDSFHVSTGIDSSKMGINILEGKQLCTQAFVSILQISDKRYYRMRRVFLEGSVKYCRKQSVRSKTMKVLEAKAWMSRFFNQIGDHMPHIQQIHLPHFLTKGDIYLRMKRELEEQGILSTSIVSKSHFYSLWKTAFKNVVIPEVTLRLNKRRTHCIIIIISLSVR